MYQKGFFAGVALSALVAVAAAGGWTAVRAEAVDQHVAAPAGAAPMSFADIVQRVAPAVVSIDVEGKAKVDPTVLSGPIPFGLPDGQGQESPFPFDFRQFFDQQGAPEAPQKMEASGSGFFISPDGYILTNNHVVEGADKITVRTEGDKKTYTARLVGRDPATDLAVIKVEGVGHPYVSFENQARPRVGDWVVAVGNPFGLGGTATAGIVSALNRPKVSGSGYVDYMQIDAPINHGNSGGPTFDVYGRVVGVNSAIYSPSGGSVGIGFDIPADVAQSISRQLIASGKVTRGFIGATVQDVTPELAQSMGAGSLKGALVAEVSPEGPAAKAGLKSGDVVLAINGQPVTSASSLTRQVGLARPGDQLRLKVRRDGSDQDVEVRSGSRPSEAVLASNDGQGGAEDGEGGGVLGMSLAPNPGGGVTIEGVTPSSEASDDGLHRGDVIVRAGQHHVDNPADVSAAVQEARKSGRKAVLLLVQHQGRRLFVPLEVQHENG